MWDNPLDKPNTRQISETYQILNTLGAWGNIEGLEDLQESSRFLIGSCLLSEKRRSIPYRLELRRWAVLTLTGVHIILTQKDF